MMACGLKKKLTKCIFYAYGKIDKSYLRSITISEIDKYYKNKNTITANKAI